MAPRRSEGFRSLTFNTAPITIDPADYPGSWYIEHVFAATGQQTVALVKGLQYLLHVTTVNGTGDVFFSVDAAGAVASAQTASVVSDGSTLRFLTAPITIDPADYPEFWYIEHVFAATGRRTVPLVKGLQYLLHVTAVNGTGDVFFSVDGAGMVASAQTASVVPDGSTLRFLTTPITIDPADYPGFWNIEHVFAAAGRQTVPLVKGLQYWLHISSVPGGGGDVFFSVDAAGSTSSAQSDSVATTGSTVRFLTTPAVVDVAQNVFWSIDRVIGATGPRGVPLVMGVEYLLVSGGGSAVFAVTGPCAFAPATFVVGGATFSLTCESVVADAGPDQTVDEGVVVTLDGSASTPPGVSLEWVQRAGPSVVLSDPNGEVTTFRAPALAGGFGSQTLTFQLMASSGSASSTATVNIDGEHHGRERQPRAGGRARHESDGQRGEPGHAGWISELRSRQRPHHQLPMGANRGAGGDADRRRHRQGDVHGADAGRRRRWPGAADVCPHGVRWRLDGHDVRDDRGRAR